MPTGPLSVVMQHLLADLVAEGLALILALLALSLDAVPEDFVKEHAAGAA